MFTWGHNFTGLASAIWGESVRWPDVKPIGAEFFDRLEAEVFDRTGQIHLTVTLCYHGFKVHGLDLVYLFATQGGGIPRDLEEKLGSGLFLRLLGVTGKYLPPGVAEPQ